VETSLKREYFIDNKEITDTSILKWVYLPMLPIFVVDYLAKSSVDSHALWKWPESIK
jgi:hypothetical protein